MVPVVCDKTKARSVRPVSERKAIDHVDVLILLLFLPVMLVTILIIIIDRITLAKQGDNLSLSEIW